MLFGWPTAKLESTVVVFGDDDFSGWAERDTLFGTCYDGAIKVYLFLAEIGSEWQGLLRPFLTQSDSASLKRPFSPGLFFRLDPSGPSSYRQSRRFHSFCALPRGGWCEGVLLYVQQAKSVGSSVLRAVPASNGSTNLRPSE